MKIRFQTSKFNIEFTALDNKMQKFDRKLLGSKVKRVGDDQEDDYPTGYFYTSQDYLELQTSEIKQFLNLYDPPLTFYFLKN